MEAISNEICQKVRNKIDIRTIFSKKKPADAIADIEASIEVLDRWYHEFFRTKTTIENELSIPRWDFNIKQLFEKPTHMIRILQDLKTTCKITKEFYAILSNELAAVTGSRSNIDNVREKVSE